MRETDFPSVVPALSGLRHRPKKRLGQHFLTAPAFARRIAEAVPATGAEPVVEIGPGTGALTRFLVKRFENLHCVELDPDVLPRLRERIGDNPVTIHCANALEFDFGAIGAQIHVAGNLPYSVGARIIRSVLSWGTGIRSCTFMVQREVAQRICSRPGRSSRGFLSVFCHYYGSPRVLFHVPPGAFFPRPRVESSVFQLVVEPALCERIEAGRREQFFRFVDKGFSQRRKKLVRVLADGRHDAQMVQAFDACGIAPLSRAQDLELDEWVRLFGEVHG